MAIKFKEIKRCQMITQTMVKDHQIGPGTLFVFKDKPQYFNKYKVEVDERGIVLNKPDRGRYLDSHVVQPGEPVMFVDVVYDPYLRNHLLRFLHNEQMIAIIFKKGETIKQLKAKAAADNSLEESNDK